MSDKSKHNKFAIATTAEKEPLTYPGMLDFARRHGIQSLETSLLQAPSPTNNHTAICSATLVTKEGNTFTDIGDANPDNVPQGCAESPIRIAVIRAKTQVLSDAFDFSVCLEESPDGVAPWNNGGNIIDTTCQVVSKPTFLPAGSSKPTGGGGRKPISAGQQKFIVGLSQQQGQDPEKLAQEHFGKALSDLQGGQADALIKSLKA